MVHLFRYKRIDKHRLARTTFIVSFHTHTQRKPDSDKRTTTTAVVNIYMSFEVVSPLRANIHRRYVNRIGGKFPRNNGRRIESIIFSGAEQQTGSIVVVFADQPLFVVPFVQRRDGRVRRTPPSFLFRYRPFDERHLFGVRRVFRFRHVVVQRTLGPVHQARHQALEFRRRPLVTPAEVRTIRQPV